MEKTEARLKIAVHAGKTENFIEGYSYVLRYGVKSPIELQQKFDEIFECLKELKEVFDAPEVEREFLADLNQILLSSIIYINNEKSAYGIVNVFAEVLAETILYLLEQHEVPFEAFDNYKENYDDILHKEIMQ